MHSKKSKTTSKSSLMGKGPITFLFCRTEMSDRITETQSGTRCNNFEFENSTFGKKKKKQKKNMKTPNKKTKTIGLAL